MPEFKPTRATALVYNNGHVIATTSGPVGSSFTGHECLILPAWRPIAEAPKDGTFILLYNEDFGFWEYGRWEPDGRKFEGHELEGAWTRGDFDEHFKMTRIYAKWWLPMLPPPNPEEHA